MKRKQNRDEMVQTPEKRLRKNEEEKMEPFFKKLWKEFS
jgi:hypothetical protein